MQLFISPYIQTGNTISIVNTTLLHQCRKVLRMRLGDVFCVQMGPSATERYTVRIDSWDDTTLFTSIIQKDLCNYTLSCIRMLVAMPNKWDKAELIVQKLSEIGVAAIGFWPAHRSVIKQHNDAKMQRLMKIAQEATEQSWGWRIPEVSFVDDVQSWISHDALVVFDKGENALDLYAQSGLLSGGQVVGIVGPEGGLSPEDYTILPKHIVVRLGNTIYRTETAAIIGGWYLHSTCAYEKNS